MDCLTLRYFIPLRFTAWFRPSLQGAGWFVLFLVSIPLGAQTDRPEFSDDLAMAQGLRDRRLFELADYYCEQRLTQKDIPSAHRANLVVEKIRTQMARALESPAADRQQQWEQAQRIANEYLTQNPNDPRRKVVELQQALAKLAEGRLIAAEIRVDSVSEANRQRGLDQLRDARRRFDGLIRDLTRQLGNAPAKPDNSGTFTNEQLHAILANLHFQLALASLETAGFYPSDNRQNRIDVLVSVISELKEMIGKLDPQTDLSASAQLRLAEAERMIGNGQEAKKHLDRVGGIALSEENQALYWEQCLELARESGDEEAAGVLLGDLENRPRLRPTTRLAMLRALFAMADRSQGAKQAEWLARAENLMKSIELNHGGYWSRLAEKTLLASSTKPEQGPRHLPGAASDPRTTTDLIVRTGEIAWREARWQDARKAFDQALALSVEAQHWDVAFRAGLKSAQASEKLGEFERAAGTLLQLATAQPEHVQSSFCHLRAIWNISQLAAHDPAQTQKYRELLDFHLDTWPNRESAGQARIWLARFQLANRELALALKSYLAVAGSSPHAVTAAQDLRGVVPQFLGDLQQQGKSGRDEVRILFDQLWSEEFAQGNVIALAWRRIAAAPLVAEYETVDPRLAGLEFQKLLNGAAKDDSSLYQALLCGATAMGVGDPQLLAQIDEWFAELKENAAELKVLLELLSKRATGEAGDDLRKWQLKTLEQLEALAQDSQEKTQWQLETARRLFEQAQYMAATERLINIVEKHPNRGDAQLLLARSLGQTAGREEAALKQWRQVSPRLKDHSDEWFESKHEIARLLLATGKKAQAHELLKLLKTVPPGWAESRWNEALEELLGRCRE